ncbi:hypothetical protein ALP94_02590 [Pseudomonas savastanoi pv. glycinea]|nr:hypothetical protein ALP94_02590 [Pseudomonas savastanoi pv. glycinea]
MIERRKNSFGITEVHWSSLNEDQKLKWRMLSRIITFLAAYAVTKTGAFFVDGLIAVASTALSALLIETQRSYSRYSVRMRKRLVRITIFLGSWCIAMAGVVLFAQVSFFSLVSSFSSMPMPSIDGRHQELKTAFYIAIFIVACAYAIIKVFRDLKFEELIYHLPRQQMKKLLIRRSFELEGVCGFACFELAAILLTVCYAGIASSLATGILMIINAAAHSQLG